MMEDYSFIVVWQDWPGSQALVKSTRNQELLNVHLHKCLYLLIILADTDLPNLPSIWQMVIEILF